MAMGQQFLLHKLRPICMSTVST